MKKYLFPLPPLSEQRRIVEILDQADEIRKLRKQADEKAEKIIPALFYEMFGDLATNPNNWNTKSLGKDVYRSKRYSFRRKGNHLAYLGLEHIESNSGRISISEDEAIKIKIIGIIIFIQQSKHSFWKTKFLI